MVSSSSPSSKTTSTATSSPGLQDSLGPLEEESQVEGLNGAEQEEIMEESHP